MFVFSTENISDSCLEFLIMDKMDIEIYETPQIELWNMHYEGLMCVSSDDSSNEVLGENQGAWNY